MTPEQRTAAETGKRTGPPNLDVALAPRSPSIPERRHKKQEDKDDYTSDNTDDSATDTDTEDEDSDDDTDDVTGERDTSPFSDHQEKRQNMRNLLLSHHAFEPCEPCTRGEEDGIMRLLKDHGLGGMQKAVLKLFRHVLLPRTHDPSDMKKLGVGLVRGVLLHGPPGTGKSKMASVLCHVLRDCCRKPVIKRGPELLDSLVGKSEANVRDMFRDAEREQQLHGSASALHILVLDEIDALCKKRGSGTADSGGAQVQDNVVNQLLTYIDGVNPLNNVLIIGTTNRIDVMDDALLRPGRLEEHIWFGYPSAEDRADILKVHCRRMVEHRFCAPTVDLDALGASDLMAGFSGAHIKAVVDRVTNRALAARRYDPAFALGPEEFVAAVREVRANEADSKNMGRSEFSDVAPRLKSLLERCSYRRSRFSDRFGNKSRSTTIASLDHGKACDMRTGATTCSDADMTDAACTADANNMTDALSSSLPPPPDQILIFCRERENLSARVLSSLASRATTICKLITPEDLLWRSVVHAIPEALAAARPGDTIILYDLESAIKYTPLAQRFCNDALYAIKNCAICARMRGIDVVVFTSLTEYEITRLGIREHDFRFVHT